MLRDTLAVEIGEIVRLDDVLTGFDDNKLARPCLIVSIDKTTRGGIWVVPRSTQKTPRGIYVPKGVAGLNKDGWFMVLPRRVAKNDLEGCESEGSLPANYLEAILEEVNFSVVDLEMEL